VEAAQAAGVAAAVGFLVIAVFQVALALGAPLGRAAWGGANDRLPTRLRIASGIAAVVWVLAGIIVLGRVGIEVLPLPSAVYRWGTWVLVGLLLLGALVNFASRSAWERFLWGPFALLLAVLCFLVARS
jgi:hypothetical protein